MSNAQLLIQLVKTVAAQHGITNYEISKRSGISQSNLVLYFNGTTMPSLEKYLQLADAVGLNVFFEPKDSATDLNKAFEKAMSELGRRQDNLPKN